MLQLLMPLARQTDLFNGKPKASVFCLDCKPSYWSNNLRLRGRRSGLQTRTTGPGEPVYFAISSCQTTSDSFRTIASCCESAERIDSTASLTRTVPLDLAVGQSLLECCDTDGGDLRATEFQQGEIR